MRECASDSESFRGAAREERVERLKETMFVPVSYLGANSHSKIFSFCACI
jgi:hypothetical protein